VSHIAGRDFTPVIEAALAAPDSPGCPAKYLTTGFGRNTL